MSYSGTKTVHHEQNRYKYYKTYKNESFHCLATRSHAIFADVYFIQLHSFTACKLNVYTESSNILAWKKSKNWMFYRSRHRFLAYSQSKKIESLIYSIKTFLTGNQSKVIQGTLLFRNSTILKLANHKQFHFRLVQDWHCMTFDQQSMQDGQLNTTVSF